MKPNHLEEQIYKCLDGDLSEDEQKDLFSLLQKEENGMACYIQCATLDAELQRFTGEDYGTAEIIPRKKVSPQNKRLKVGALLALAACLALCTALFFLKAPATSLAQIHPAPDAQYTLKNSASLSVNGHNLSPGDLLSLTSGSLDLIYPDGVEATLHAPAEIRLLNAQSLHLDRGTAWINVPPKMKGFTVFTPQRRIVDLGTAFGVSVGVVEEVHVTSGKVITYTEEQPSLTLSEGEAVRWNAAGKQEEISPQPYGAVLSHPTPLLLTKGTHPLPGRQGEYTVSTSAEEIAPPLPRGDFLLDEGGSLRLRFSRPVNLQITRPEILQPPHDCWNSHEDYGTLTHGSKSPPKLLDPNQEFSFKARSTTTGDWTFTRKNNDHFRIPSLQTFRLNILETKTLELTKEPASTGRAAFKIQLINPKQ